MINIPINFEVNKNRKTGIRYGYGHGNMSYLYELMIRISSEGEDVYFKENLKGLRGKKRQELIDTWENGDLYRLKTKELFAMYDSNDNSITIFKSLYKTKCSLCSPCAPNGGDLGNANIWNGHWTYCTEDTPGAVKIGGKQ